MDQLVLLQEKVIYNSRKYSSKFIIQESFK